MDEDERAVQIIIPGLQENGLSLWIPGIGSTIPENAISDNIIRFG
jgi:hypothetical protein